MGWKEIFANNDIYKGLFFKIHKEFIQFYLKKKSKMGRDLNRYFSKENIQMANRHVKRCNSANY